MFSKEKNYFLQIIADYLHGDNSEMCENIDWNLILKFAKTHQLNGIVCNQCSSFLPPEEKNTLMNFSASELVNYIKRKKMYTAVKDKFSSNGIQFFAVKGKIVSEYYPIPQNRTMGDCDLLIHTNDSKKCHQLMTDLGFKEHQTPDYERFYKLNGFAFEIHDHLLYDEIANRKEEIEFCDKAWQFAKPIDNSSELVLDESFHFIFLLLHLKKHIIHKGAGFRQFMDIYTFAKNANLNWDFINTNLEKLNLLKFSQVCGALTLKWFAKGESEKSVYGFDIPVVDDAFYEEVTEKIFGNGIFGSDDSSNENNTELQGLINKENSNFVDKILSAIHCVFPQYNNVRFAPKYSFVNNKPWLLPVVWVYRFILVIFGKAGDKSKSAITSESLSQRKEMLSNFGLI